MNMNKQLYDFLNEQKKFMTAEEIIEAGFRFKGIKTTRTNVRNVMSKLQDVDRQYLDNGECKVMVAANLWAQILRRPTNAASKA